MVWEHVVELMLLPVLWAHSMCTSLSYPSLILFMNRELCGCHPHFILIMNIFYLFIFLLCLSSSLPLSTGVTMNRNKKEEQGIAWRIGWQKWALNRSIPCVFHSLFFSRSRVSFSYSSLQGPSPAVLCGRQMALSLLFVWKCYSYGLKLGSTANSTYGFSLGGRYAI